MKQKFRQFVIPSIVAQWVFALYTMIDGIFIARGVSEHALAAVNIAIPFVNFIFAVSLIIAVGTSTIVSISLGKKDIKTSNEIYTQNTLFVIISAFIITAFIQLNLSGIASFLGADEITFEYVKTYVGTIAYTIIFFMLGYYFEILIKVDGRPKMATLMVTIGALLNCFLDYLFVIVFKWGMFGAAFATGLSQFAVCMLFLTHFLSKKASLRFVRFKPSVSAIGKTIILGLPSGITDFSAGLMIFIFNHAILRYLNSDAIISYTIAAYVNTIVVMSMAGIVQGMQPLVSYSYGQNDKAACNTLFQYAIRTGIGISVVIFACSILLTKPIVSLFISKDLVELTAYTVRVFRIFSISFLIVGFNVIIGGYFTAIEREFASIMISLGRGVVFIVVSLFIVISLWGGEGIWWAAALSEILCLGLSMIFLYAHKHETAGKSSSVLVNETI